MEEALHRILNLLFGGALLSWLDRSSHTHPYTHAKTHITSTHIAQTTHASIIKRVESSVEQELTPLAHERMIIQLGLVLAFILGLYISHCQSTSEPLERSS